MTTESTVELGGEITLRKWHEQEDVLVAGAMCPLADCGTLALAYRTPDRTRRDAEWWVFTCGRCDIESVAPESELVFQSVPKCCLLPTAALEEKEQKERPRSS